MRLTSFLPRTARGLGPPPPAVWGRAPQSSTAQAQASRAPAVRPARAPFTKPFTFSSLEDYDKGDARRDVGRDLALFRDLGVAPWRGSFGWDDYEPVRGRCDFAWLHRFVELA